jgi:hypothetical protein
MAATVSLTVDLATLRKKVNFVRNGLGASKSDLQMQLIRCDVTGHKLTMFAANKEMLCRCETKIDREEAAPDGSFSVLGHKLATLVSTAEAERVTLEADQENLKVTAGFLTVNLTLYDGASLRSVEQGCAEHLRTEGRAIARDALEEALSCGKSCTTTNSIRPDVNHVELRGGKLLASDGRKIMIYANDTFDEEINLKVPAGTLNSVISALKNIEAEKVNLHEGPSYYFIKGNLSEYSTGIRKTERNFPDVEGMVTRGTQEPDDEIAVDKHVLTAALAGVALGLESEEVKVTFDLDGAGTSSVLEVSAQNNLGRRSFERTSCGRTGTRPLSFPVSYKHMLDTLSVFKGDSVVDIGVNQKLSLLTVKDSNAVRQVLTMIPFRTDGQIQAEKADKAAEEEARKSQAITDTAEDGERELDGAVEEDLELA